MNSMNIKELQIKRKSLYLMFLFILCAVFSSYGKSAISSDTTTSAENALELAKSEFDKGHYLKVYPAVNKQIEFFNKQEKIEAYQLLARTLIELDEADSARQYIHSIIKQDPLYTPSEDIVQQDYIQYFNSFTTRPQVSVTAGLGLNKSKVINEEMNNTYQGTAYDEKTSGNTGEQYFILFDFYFSKRVSIQTGVVYSIYNYSKNYFIENSYTSSYLEKLQYFEVPILARYRIPINKDRFFVSIKAGPNISFLDRATSDIEISDATKSVIDENTIYNKNAYNENSFISGVESSYNRVKELVDLLGGVEFGYKNNRSVYGLEFNYILSFSNTTKNSSFLPANQDQSFYYYHSDNQFKINKLKFSFFYRYIFNYRTRPKLKNE